MVILFKKRCFSLASLILFFVLSTPLFVIAQDVHLTQYYTNNQSLNPAYTGNYYGDVRMVANSRSQWGQVSSPIKTNYFSVEKKILRFPDEIGVGVLFINDQVTAYNLITNKIMLSGSYQKEIRKNIFRVGIQAGLVFRSINTGSQTFPDQWNYYQGVYDPSVPSGESNIQNLRAYPDFNIGGAWSRRFGIAKVTIGYAIFNVNRPHDGFVPTTSAGLPFKHVFSPSATFSVSSKTNIIPYMLYMRTAKATDFMFGSNATYALTHNTSILFGAGYRGSTVNSDAIIGVAGLTYKRFQLGFSMDFTVSQLNDAKNKSAWEIMITYTTPSRIPGKVSIPCQRY